MAFNNKFKTIAHAPLTVCFTLFIAGMFLMYFIVPDKEMSEWENRYLKQRPDINFIDVKDGKFMSDYEGYINDQIPMRNELIKLKALSETALFKLENNGIVKGEDGHLFEKCTRNTSVFDKNISLIGQFVKSIENDVTVAIIPNASCIISDKVPKGFPIIDQSEKLSRIYADKSLLKGASVIDLNSALSAHEDEYIYYYTDHHWTSEGAYIAYSEISENPVDKDRLKASFKDGFYGTLYAKYKGIFVKPDVITYYDIPVKSFTTDSELRDGLYDLSKLSVFDKYGMFMYGNFGRCDIITNVNNGKSAVIFKDSYANCLIPFLTFDYEYITVIDLRFFDEPVSELISEHKDSDVLFIYNFDFLNEDNHFYRLTK